MAFYWELVDVTKDTEESRLMIEIAGKSLLPPQGKKYGDKKSSPVEKRVMLNLASIKEEFSKWLIKIKNDAGQYRIMGYDFYNEKILVERSCGMEWVELSKCKFISKVST